VLPFVRVSVTELHHFYAAPVPSENFDAVPAPTPTLLNSKPKIFKIKKKLTEGLTLFFLLILCDKNGCIYE
jgi:hypothetical protein